MLTEYCFIFKPSLTHSIFTKRIIYTFNSKLTYLIFTSIILYVYYHFVCLLVILIYFFIFVLYLVSGISSFFFSLPSPPHVTLGILLYISISLLITSFSGIYNQAWSICLSADKKQNWKESMEENNSNLDEMMIVYLKFSNFLINIVPINQIKNSTMKIIS